MGILTNTYWLYLKGYWNWSLFPNFFCFALFVIDSNNKPKLTNNKTWKSESEKNKKN